MYNMHPTASLYILLCNSQVLKWARCHSCSHHDWRLGWLS